MAIVSLSVRFRSMTVDEFIERDALNVGARGIYLQTAHPSPLDTLACQRAADCRGNRARGLDARRHPGLCGPRPGHGDQVREARRTLPRLREQPGQDDARSGARVRRRSRADRDGGRTTAGRATDRGQEDDAAATYGVPDRGRELARADPVLAKARRGQFGPRPEADSVLTSAPRAPAVVNPLGGAVARKIHRQAA
jgi:hypothetical protein